jgi:hypothetical protein
MTSTLEFLITAKDEASKIFDKVGDSVDKQKGKFDKFQAGANIALGAVALGVGVFAKQSIDAYSEAETQQAKLGLAYEKFPALADVNIESLRSLNDELQKKTGYDNDDTAAMQASLAAFGLTGSQIEKLTPLVQDYASKTGQDLATSADAVGKAMLGSGKAMKTVGVDFTDAGSVAGNFDQVVTGLTAKVGGYAETMGGTAAGKTKILAVQWEDLQEKAGQKLIPALTKMTDAGIKLTDWMGGHQSETTALVVGIGALGVALGVAANWTTILAIKVGILGMAETVMTTIRSIATAGVWLWNAATAASMLPITLIIAGIALLVAGFLYLWNNNEGFRKFIIAMWAGIKVAFEAVVNWVVNTMVPWLTQAFNNIANVVGTVVKWIVDRWNAAASGLQAVASWIGDAAHNIVSFFTNMPGQIASAAAGMWNGITNAFRSMVNNLIRMWNDFHITLGGGTYFGVTFPSFTMDTPNIPYLASGGSILQGGAAVVGERGPELATFPTGAHVTGNGATVSLSDATLTALAQLVGDRMQATIAVDKWSNSMGRNTPGRGH